MALIVIRKPKYSNRDSLWFDVTIENSSISVLHMGPIWSGYGNTPFSFKCAQIEKSSSEVDGRQHCDILLREEIGHMTLQVGLEQVVLKDI